MAFTSFQNQATSDAAQVTQIIDALQGTAGQGQPIALTALSDAANYALDVRNQDSTNGYAFRVLDAAGAALLRVFGTTTGYVESLKKLVLTLPTLTLGQNHLAITATWNAGGETFKAIFVNITASASAAASRLLDLQAASSSVFSVTTAGNVTAAGTLAITGKGTAVGGFGTRGIAVATSSQSTASATNVDLDSMTVTLTTVGGDLLGWLACSSANDGSSTNTFSYKLDSEANVDTASTAGISTFRITSVAAGAHTVKIQWRSGAGNASCTYRSLLIWEV